MTGAPGGAGSSWTDTSVKWGIGNFAGGYNVGYCNVFNVCTPQDAWWAKFPASAGGYGASFGVSGPQLINTSNQQCGSVAAIGASQDCIVYPAGGSLSPPSICLQGGCYLIPNTYTAYKTNSTGSYTATVNANYYVYRFVFSVTIIVNISTASVSVVCDPNFQGNVCPQVPLCLPGSLFSIGCTDPTGDFRNWLNSWTTAANANTHLTNSQISLQINTPLNAVQSNLDWTGIYGAWIGGQGPQVSGSCGAGITNTACVTGLAAHNVLGIYQDPLLTIGAYPTNTNQWSGFLPGYNLQQLQSILPQSLRNTVYVSIPLSDFGGGFTVSSNCPVNGSGCFTASPSVTMTIPIIYDVMGSKTPFYGSYQWVQTQTNCLCQTVYGRVLDGNSPLGIFGIYNPLQGALACVGTCPLTASQSQATVTNSTGWFTLPNVPLTTGGAQTVNIYIQDNGYNPIQTQPYVSVAGQPINAGTFTMQPTAAGLSCLLPPIPNPVPGLPPLFGGICIPTWEVVGIFVSAIALIAFTLFLIVPSRRKLGVSAGRVSGSI